MQNDLLGLKSVYLSNNIKSLRQLVYNQIIGKMGHFSTNLSMIKSRFSVNESEIGFAVIRLLGTEYIFGCPTLKILQYLLIPPQLSSLSFTLSKSNKKSGEKEQKK